MPLPTNLLPVKIDREEYAITRYSIETMPGVVLGDVLDPDFWVHLARRFRVHDIVSVEAADGAFDVDLRVVAIDPRGLWAQMRPLRLCGPGGVPMPGQAPKQAAPVASQWPDKDGYTVEFSGPHKWRILDRANNVVAKDFPDEVATIEALNNLKAAKPKRAA